MQVSVEPNVNVQEPAPHQKKRKSVWDFLLSQKAYVYLIPALILLGIFTVYPIFNTLLNSLMVNYDGKFFDGWGIDNFTKVVSYRNFLTCLTNTLLFAFISVPISTLLALFISVWLNNIKWLQKAYQTIFFLPYLTNAIAIGAVFNAMFNVVSVSGNIYDPNTGEMVAQSVGLINTITGWFGIPAIEWVTPGSGVWAQRTVVILYSIWAGLPFKILILFSALQSVNKQYYDAAKIDGANKMRTLWKVTVPLISPMISYLVITGFIGGFKEYTTVVGIFGPTMGANNGDMNTMVGFIYDSISTDRTGIAAAGALILFAIILVFTGINFYVSKKKVHY